MAEKVEHPSEEAVAKAKLAVIEEVRAAEEAGAAEARERSRRGKLPSEHPEHLHGPECFQGSAELCRKLRDKLGLPKPR